MTTPAAGTTPAPTPVTPATPAAAPATPAADPAAPATPTPEEVAAAKAAEAAKAAVTPDVIGDPAPNEGDTSAETAVSYQPTGDAGLDLALDYIGNLGLGPDHPAVVAAADGAFEKLEATLEAMGDKAKNSDKYVALAKAAYQRTADQTAATEAAVKATVVEVAGGSEQWEAIKKWSGQNADPDEKAAINEMLKSGPVQARAAAALLLNAYNSASGTVVTPKSVVKDDTVPNTPTTNGALSPQDYQAEVRKLRGQMGFRMEGSEEYKALQSRRLAFQG